MRLAVVFFLLCGFAQAATVDDNEPSRIAELKERFGMQYIPGRVIVKLSPETCDTLDANKYSFSFAELPLVMRQNLPFGIYSMERLLQEPIKSAEAWETREDCKFKLMYQELSLIPSASHLVAEEQTFREIKRMAGRSGIRIWRNQIGTVQQASPLPNDPLVSDQWHLEAMNVPKLWYNGKGGITGSRSSRVTMVFMDTGTRLHADLVTNLNQAASKSFYGGSNPFQDEISHGTRTMGACAVGNNGLGISGVAWECNAVMLRVGTTGYTASRTPYAYIDEAAVLAAFAHILNSIPGTVVVNCSFVVNGISELLGEVIMAGRERMIVFAAVGNDGSDSVTRWPACLAERLDNVIGVGSIDPSGEISSFSNKVVGCTTTLAPGRKVLSIKDSADYANWDGTSAASPNAAVAGYLWVTALDQRGVTINSAVFKKIKTAVAGGSRRVEGFPRLDAWEVWQKLETDLVPVPTPTNRQPTIALTCDTTEVVSGQRVNCLATASDPDGDRLNYRWLPEERFTLSSEPGRAVFETAGINSTPGNLPIRVDIGVVVKDGRGGEASVIQALTINAPTANPDPAHSSHLPPRSRSRR